MVKQLKDLTRNRFWEFILMKTYSGQITQITEFNLLMQHLEVFANLNILHPIKSVNRSLKL